MAVSKSKKIKYMDCGNQRRPFEGSPSDTSRDSATQEQNATIIVYTCVVDRNFEISDHAIDHHSDLFKINKDIGELVRARSMQQNGSQKARNDLLRKK